MTADEASHDDRIPLTRLRVELEKLTSRPMPPYRRLQSMVSQGKIPAVKGPRGWTIDRSSLAELARSLDKTTLGALLPLVEVSAALEQMTGHKGPGYRRLYMNLVNGRFDAHKEGHYWLVARSELPRIADVLGLRKVEEGAASTRHRRAA